MVVLFDFHARILLISVLPVILLALTPAQAQTSSFTYQGRLTDGGTAANGNYDLQFALFDSQGGGAQVGPTQTLNSVLVSAGVFTVTLDFGANSFPGGNRFLEISARPSGVGSFNLLTPRQPVTATPYAMRSANAASADALSNACVACVQDSQIDSVSGSKITGTVANAASATSATNATNATNATTATNATQLAGIAASQYVQINDSRLSDARAPTPGSSNYIQTTPNTAQNANFNINGTGSASVLNAATQYNLGGSRVLSSNSDSTFIGLGVGTNASNFLGFNTFVGSGAGSLNIQGANNSLFGYQAGFQNTNGVHNSFFGSAAGRANTSSENSFFGTAAGFSTSTGCCNSFFGDNAGLTNATGAGNIAIGDSADFGAGDLHNATVIGSNAVVSTSNSIVLGRSIDKVGISVSAPAFKLHVIDLANTGLRVETDAAGGTVASFGGQGEFQIDAPNVFGGRLIVKESGNVGIGTTSPDNKLTVNGTADKPAGGSWGTFSDERLKNIKGSFTPGLKAVMSLQPLRYEYKRDNALGIKSDGEHVGFSAQAVQKIIPEAVSANDKGYLLVNNDPILWTMLNAIKEQQTQILKQQAELKQAEERALVQLNELHSLRIAKAALDARLQRIEKMVRRQRHPGPCRSRQPQ